MSLPASAQYAGAFSYSDLPKGSPLSIVTAMPGVKNMLKYLALEEGESVVVLAEYTADQTVVQAIAAGVAFAGAEVHIMHTTPFPIGGCRNTSDLVRSLLNTVDVIISCSYWGEVHTDHLFFDQIMASKTRMLSLHQAATMSVFETAAKFPAELAWQLEETFREDYKDANKIHVTTADGTDLLWDGGFTFKFMAKRFKAGEGLWRPFPPAGLNWSAGNVSGTIVLTDSTATGVTAAPVRLTVKNGRVVGAEGDKLGVRDTLQFSPSGYYVRHALIGLNPKVRRAGGTQFEREKHAGSFYLGLDGLRDGKIDMGRPGNAHNDIQFDRVSIWINGEQVVDDGDLLWLNRPHVRALAAPEDGDVWDCNPRVTLPDVRHRK